METEQDSLPFRSVLVVDDHEPNRYLLKVLLEGHGCTVSLACDGEEALELTERFQFDLAISDLLMPKMDGYTLLARWIECPRLRTIPFVVYTGTYTEPDDRDLAQELGAQAFLVKPLEPTELLKELVRVVRAFSIATPPSPADHSAETRHTSVLLRKLTKRNRELEANEARLQAEVREREAVLDALEARVALLDENGCITRVNRAWREFADRAGLGLPQYGVGTSYFQSFGENGDSLDPQISRPLNSLRMVVDGQLGSFSYDYPCGETGKTGWFRLLATHLQGAPGLAALVMHIDVTEEKQIEFQQLRSQRLESIGTLAGGIAHDLNNTLLPILMASELLDLELNEPQQKKLLRSIEKSAKRGSDLVKQLLTFAKGAEGEPVIISLVSLVREVLKIVRETFPRQIAITEEIQDDTLETYGDRTQLYQVLLNLCLNAKDSMVEGGKLCVRLRRALTHESQGLGKASRNAREDSLPGAASLEVSDTGQGILPENLQRIFDPFFTTKEYGKGTGLGLSTSLAIVERHGGTLQVDSEPGRGSVFKVLLPLQAGQKPAKPVTAARTLARGSGETVLVVDDEPAIRQLTRRLLEMAGYRVLLAAHGGEALELFRSRGDEIDLLLTDMMMPVMDGPTLIDTLLKERPHLKVVACSGLESASRETAEKLSARFEFLSKPFSAHELLGTLQRVLQEPAPSPADR